MDAHITVVLVLSNLTQLTFGLPGPIYICASTRIRDSRPRDLGRPNPGAVIALEPMKMQMNFITIVKMEKPTIPCITQNKTRKKIIKKKEKLRNQREKEEQKGSIQEDVEIKATEVPKWPTITKKKSVRDWFH